jgi:hypothetical protein
MEMYKKPVMDIIDLERIDVLTASGYCATCAKTVGDIESHNNGNHEDAG